MTNTQKQQETTDAPRIMPAPSVEELQEWMAQGGCYTACGCWVEPDGHCPHDNPSFLLELGMI